jgi:hypothetical protein
MAVYTDGSFLDASTGSAFIYDAVFSYWLHNFNFIFTTELCLIPSSSVHLAPASTVLSPLHRLPKCLAESQ